MVEKKLFFVCIYVALFLMGAISIVLAEDAISFKTVYGGTIQENQVLEGFTKTMYAGDALAFRLNNVTYPFVLTYTKDNTIYFIITSDDQRRETSQEDNFIDLDEDGSIDLYMRVTNIAPGKATISMKAADKTPLNVSEVKNQTVEVVENETSQDIPSEKGETPYAEFVIPALGVLAVIVIIFYFYNRKKS